MEYSIEAKVIDSHHLTLNEPIDIPSGSVVIVTIETREQIAEADSWYSLSEGGLNRAYGENEPDYPLDLIIIPNDEYQP